MLLLLAILLVGTPVLAAAYSASLTVTETNGTPYDMLPVIADAPVTWMVNNDYMDADGLDTRVQTTATAPKPHLVTDNKILTAIPVPANSQTNLVLSTDNTPLPSMDIITGYGGYITILDDDTLELTNDFESELDGWIDTDAGAGKNLVYKQGGFRTYIDGATNITSVIYADAPYSPDPHDEVTSVDGYTEHVDDSKTWAQVVAGVGTAALDSGTFYDTAVYIVSDGDADEWDSIFRSIFLFDTSPLADDAVIDYATVALYGSSKAKTLVDDDFSVGIYSSLPASDVALVAGDFDSLGATLLSDVISYADWDIAGYNTFTLNATGIAAISVDDITKFGIREATYDATGIEPTWGAGKTLSFGCYYADEAGTAKDPVLTVYYEDVEVTDTGISSGEHTVVTRADGTFMEILVDVENLIWNSDFEVGDPPTDWDNVDCATFEQDNAIIKVGTYSLKIIGNGVGAWANASQTTGLHVTYAGEDVTLGAWMRADSGNDTNQILRIQGMADWSSLSSSGAVPKDDDWHWMSVTHAMPLDADILKALFYINDAVADNDDILYVDGAILVEGDSIPAEYISNPPVTVALAGASVPDTPTDWLIMDNSTTQFMSYMDYYKHTVSGVEHAWYEPNYTLTDAGATATLIDRSYYGLSFDGINDLVNCGNDPSLYSADGTWECWVNFTTTDDAESIMDTDGAGWLLGDATLRTVSSGKVYFRLDDGSAWVGSVTSDNVINDGDWHHIVVTFGSGGMKLYIDKTLQADTDVYAGGTAGSSTALGLGGRSLGASYWTGLIDEVRVYDRVIIEDEIEANYNSGVGNYTPYDTTGLVGWWHMEEGSGTTIADSSGEGNTGNITEAIFVNGLVPSPAGNSGTNDGTVTWGANPAGIGAILSSMVSSDQPGLWTPSDEPVRDIMPEIETSDWFVEPAVGVGESLRTNPMRPIITMVSDNTTITELQTWRWMGIIIVLLVTALTVKAVPKHLVIACFAGGAATVAMVVSTIWPLWALVLLVLYALGGWVSERSPSL